MINSINQKNDNPRTKSASWSFSECLTWQEFDAGSASFTLPLPTFKNILPKIDFRINRRRLLPDATLPSSTWELTRPLWLNVEQDENGLFVVSDDVFVMFGTGDTEEEALHDYVSSLIEYYELLSQKNDEPTKQLFRHLQTYFHPA